MYMSMFAQGGSTLLCSPEFQPVRAGTSRVFPAPGGVGRSCRSGLLRMACMGTVLRPHPCPEKREMTRGFYFFPDMMLKKVSDEPRFR